MKNAMTLKKSSRVAVLGLLHVSGMSRRTVRRGPAIRLTGDHPSAKVWPPLGAQLATRGTGAGLPPCPRAAGRSVRPQPCHHVPARRAAGALQYRTPVERVKPVAFLLTVRADTSVCCLAQSLAGSVSVMSAIVDRTARRPRCVELCRNMLSVLIRASL